MKNITLPQALVLLACIAAPIAAYKFLGSPEAAAASMVVGMILNFLLGRDPPSGPGPNAPATASSGELRVLSAGRANGLMRVLGLAS
jgi:hypothetical protein